MAALRKVPARCPRFEDSQTSSTVTVRLGKGAAIGDDSLSFTLTDPRWQGGSTLEAVRIGTTVVTVFYSANSGTGAPQAKVFTGLLAGRVLQRILAKT
jgi:hypothetical protein